MEFIGEDVNVDSNVAAAVEDKLLQRMKERTEQISKRSEQRRNEQTNRNTELETADAFLSSFNEMRQKLEEDLANIDQMEAEEPTAVMDKFDTIVRDHSYIQQYLNESHMFLASFQIKRSQEILSDLNVEIQRKMNLVQPKKKFGFRAKSNKPKPRVFLTKQTTDSTDSQKTNTALEKILNEKFTGFKNLSGKRLVMNHEDIVDRQLNLHNLMGCTVLVLGVPGTIQIANLKDCTVLIGPTKRSAFIKNCSGCTFVMACQQVRIHNTADTNFYLHVTGAAIIESCHNVGFAPYNLEYSDLDEHFLTSGLDRNVNNWDKVDDFKWINENEKSPNMFLIEETERKNNWIPTN